MSSCRVSRRTLMSGAVALFAAPLATVLPSGCENTEEGGDESAGQNAPDSKSMKIHYLEIVTPDTDAAVEVYSQIHGVEFGAPDPSLGGARTAELSDGGRLGIRAPLRDSEKPVVRPYYRVDGIEKAVALASRAGAQVAMNPTEIPGSGRFAIIIQGGVESGLWQLPS